MWGGYYHNLYNERLLISQVRLLLWERAQQKGILEAIALVWVGSMRRDRSTIEDWSISPIINTSGDLSLSLDSR
jgi:hypothetical protein